MMSESGNICRVWSPMTHTHTHASMKCPNHQPSEFNPKINCCIPYFLRMKHHFYTTYFLDKKQYIYIYIYPQDLELAWILAIPPTIAGDKCIFSVILAAWQAC